MPCALAATWLVFRLESIVRKELPQEIQAQSLKISLWSGGFSLDKVTIAAAQDYPADCAGKILFTVDKISGAFRLWGLKLNSLTLEHPRLREVGRKCLGRNSNKNTLGRLAWLEESGLQIEVAAAEYNLPDFGTVKIDAVAWLKPHEQGYQITSESIAARAEAGSLQFNKVKLAWRDGAYTLDAMGSLAIPELGRLKRLKTKQLTVERGGGFAKFSATANRGEWTGFTSIDLKGIGVKGEPLNKMPLGFLELTPQSIWPMAEDKPGQFSFAFKTRSADDRLVKTFVADLQRAFVQKLKANLKKKIPILPF